MYTVISKAKQFNAASLIRWRNGQFETLSHIEFHNDPVVREGLSGTGFLV